MSKVVSLNPKKHKTVPTKNEQIAGHFDEKWVSTYKLLTELDSELQEDGGVPNLLFLGGSIPVMDMENGVTIYNIIDPDHVQDNVLPRTTIREFRKETASLALATNNESVGAVRYLRDLVDALCNEFRLVNFEFNERHGVVWLDRAYSDSPVTYRHVVRVELWRPVDTSLMA